MSQNATYTVIQSPSNWALETARGNISGTSLITKYGYNADVDLGTLPEDVWSQGGVYVPPTTARLHNLASSSANDTSAGTGARTVLIRGIDGSYNAVSETIILNGVSNVSTVNSYVHIHLMQVQTAGSGGANAGILTLTAVTDATVTISMIAGDNQSSSSIYMIPVGYKGYIMKIRARTSIGTASNTADIALKVMPFGGVFQLKTVLSVTSTGSSNVENDYTNSTPFIVQAKSMVKMQVLSVSSNNTPVSGEYDLILVQD